jgi:CheY-like chemotaxis protein
MSVKIVFVVEDDHDTRVSVRGALENAGYFVVSAANGADALAMLEKMTTPSIILLDVGMPIMNGNQFFEIIRKDLRFSAIPVVQMSASVTPRISGTCCVLEKPLHLKNLIAAIESCT